jgi:pimeloyl-ACP methyl ester carboxylesterase
MRTLPSAEINGFTMPYIETGDTGGIPLILIHGLTDSMRSYEPVLAELPDAIHAFAITQRGHGDAGRPADGYGALDLARDVVAFMDAAGIERAVVAGHSHGATIARRVAADYPDRVLGCVLAGAFSPLREQPGLRALLDEFRELGVPGRRPRASLGAARAVRRRRRGVRRDRLTRAGPGARCGRPAGASQRTSTSMRVLSSGSRNQHSGGTGPP